MACIFPIAYFGSVSYFQELIKHPDVQFEQWDHFPKQTFRNRMQIRDAQGLQLLTLPVERSFGSKTLTKDIRVSRQQNWQQIHWRALKTAYAASPFYEHYESDIHNFIFSKSDFLIDFHAEFLAFVAQHLDLDITSAFTTSFMPESSADDFRTINFELIPSTKNYTQVIFPEVDFIPTVSILDALFNEGPMARKLLL